MTNEKLNLGLEFGLIYNVITPKKGVHLDYSLSVGVRVWIREGKLLLKLTTLSMS